MPYEHHLFSFIPSESRYNRRLHALAPLALELSWAKPRSTPWTPYPWLGPTI